MSKTRKMNDEPFVGEYDWIYSDDEEEFASDFLPKVGRSIKNRARHARQRYDRLMEERRLRKMIDEELGY